MEYYKTVPIDSHIPLFSLQLRELLICPLVAGQQELKAAFVYLAKQNKITRMKSLTHFFYINNEIYHFKIKVCFFLLLFCNSYCQTEM